MIVFDLICGTEHRFEGWFSSHGDFDTQRARGLLVCPVCANSSVAKLPSSKIKRGGDTHRPDEGSEAVSTPVAKPAAPPTPEHLARHAQMAAFVAQVLSSTEDVGKRFADEARKIHYKEVPERAIRGQATAEDARELLEEGIPVLPLPIPPPSDLH